MKRQCFNIFKRYYSNGASKTKICIVGAGPAGFYAAQHLAKKLANVQIDIFEKLPVPFGLVRFGVAPDHPEVKNVISTFTKTAQLPNVKFIGNVTLGTDVSLKQLQEAYNGVLLTYGADENRKLNIPGENLGNVVPARRIVGWYNGIPWDSDLQIDLSGECAAIFGQGNVAIDIARILLSPIDQLKKTDITEHALEVLSKSKVKKVFLIGRRGPLQAAFTIKELREMLKLENCRTTWCPTDFNGISDVLPSLARPRKRITELMLKSLSEQGKDAKNIFVPTFHRSPLEILGSKTVEQVKLCVNKLKGDDILKKTAVLTDKTELLGCNLAITSIGYKSIQIDSDIPFDQKSGTAINTNGKISENLYAAGWLATGPTGVILTTMSNSFAIADLICKDLHLKEGELKPGFDIIQSVLKQKNVPLVDWNGWIKIDAYEKEQGAKLGKPREKILDVKKMVEIAQ